MAIDFPASPTLNQTFSSGNVNYVWDGTKWTASVTGGISLDKIEKGNTKAEVVDTGSDGRFVVTTEGSERARIDSSGRLLVGTSTSTDLYKFEVRGRDDTAAGGAEVRLSRGETATQIGNNGPMLGRIWFTSGSDNGKGAEISAHADATWSSNDYPTRLVFSVTADGASSPTERVRIANTGALGLSGANYGSSGQVLTSQGSGAAPQWATAGGAWQFISSVTASNSASVAFTSGIDSTYDVYAISFTGIDCTSAATLLMRFSTNGGSSYFSNSGDYSSALYSGTTGIVPANSSVTIARNLRTSVDNRRVHGFTYLYDAAVSGKHTGFLAHAADLDGPAYTFSSGGSNSMGTGVVNAIQFLASAGNISGTFRLYGIKNS